MKTYYLKSIAYRPGFTSTMTDSEREIMQKHVIYWNERADEGKMIIFGPVLDPEEIYGVGIIRVKDENELKNLLSDDPAIISGIQKTSYTEMNAVYSKYWNLE